MESNSNDELLKELQSRNEALNQALLEQQQLNGELLEVNKKLRESESSKSNFLSNISNEIVNPFTAITGLARSILKAGGNEPVTVMKMSTLILNEAMHLDFQLRNIFMAAAIEAGEVSPHFINADILAITRQIVESYSIELENHSIKTEIDSGSFESIEFITDPEKFELIILNLFNNALLFSNPGGTIKIRIKKTETELFFEIIDQGIGMDQDEVKVIFDRFKRLENHINSINRGNGLGLSIIKALVELISGKIEVLSEKGNGSVFRIFLPQIGPEQVKNWNVSKSGNETFFDEEVIF